MNNIYLFTNTYPFGKSEESFIESEVEVASTLNLNLTIIPLWRKKDKRDLPNNIQLNTSLADIPLKEKIIAFLNLLWSSYFWRIFIQGKHSPKSIQDILYAYKYLYGSFLIKRFLFTKIKVFEENSIIYSYWFNHTSLGAIMARKKYKELVSLKIVSRAHRYDLYEEKVGLYFPFRQLTFQEIDHVYSISNEGFGFLSERYPQFQKKISVSRLGTFPIRANFDVCRNEIAIISCSSVIPVKRVNLIFESLYNYARLNKDKKIEWTHIGAGIEFNALKSLLDSKSLPNLQISLLGSISNKEVRFLLQNSDYHTFINLSLSEGIPVSIMEAISASIPIVATDVGGNKEIVTHESGRLLDVNFSQKSFNEAIDTILYQGVALRKSTISFFLNNYDAKKNYNNFYDCLITMI